MTANTSKMASTSSPIQAKSMVSTHCRCMVRHSDREASRCNGRGHKRTHQRVTVRALTGTPYQTVMSRYDYPQTRVHSVSELRTGSSSLVRRLFQLARTLEP